MAPKDKADKKSDSKTFHELYKQFSQDFECHLDTEYIPSGSMVIDSLLGGGLPLRKLIEISSKAGVGKTLIAKHLCESILKFSDKRCLFLDVEKGLTRGLLAGPLTDHMGKRFGVLNISSFEDAETCIEQFAASGGLALVVIDSITALLPKEALDRPLDSIRPGMKAQWESTFLNKQKSLSDRCGYSILFINQVRCKLNFKGLSTTQGSGGNAVAHFCDVRFMARAVKVLKDANETPVGAEVEIKSVKNRIVGNKRANIHLVYGKGVDNCATYISYLAELGFLTRGGAMFELKVPGVVEERVKGTEALRELVLKNIVAIEKLVLEHGVISDVADDDAEASAKEIAEE